MNLFYNTFIRASRLVRFERCFIMVCLLFEEKGAKETVSPRLIKYATVALAQEGARGIKFAISNDSAELSAKLMEQTGWPKFFRVMAVSWGGSVFNYIAEASFIEAFIDLAEPGLSSFVLWRRLMSDDWYERGK